MERGRAVEQRVFVCFREAMRLVLGAVDDGDDVALERLIGLMELRDVARDSELPATGVPLDWERALSAIQIRANGYGTRTTTVLTVRNDSLVTFFERTFDTTDPERWTDRHFEFMVDSEAQPSVRARASDPD